MSGIHGKVGKYGGWFLAASFLAGTLCEDHAYQDADATNLQAQNLLQTRADDLDLVEKYHVVRDENDRDLGVIFTQSIRYEDGERCMTYQSFNSGDSSFLAVESETRVACIPTDPSVG